MSPASHGILTATLGNFTSHAQYSSHFPPAANVRGAVLTSEVWHDHPNIQVVVQVSDITGDVHCIPTQVVVRVLPDSVLSAVANIIPPQIICTSSPATGLCEATLSLPNVWFMPFDDSPNSTSISVDIRLLESLDAPLSIGTVSVNPQPLLNFVNNVAVLLPFQPLSPAELFTAPLYAHATFPVSTLSVLCSSNGLSIENVVIDDAMWMSEIRPLQYEGGQEVGVVIVLRDPESIPSNEIFQPQLIFSFELRVLISATPGTIATINCTTMHLGNIFNDKIQPDGHVTPTPSLIIDSNSANSPIIGEVRIAQNIPKALFSFADRAQIVNTAFFNGLPIIVPLTHLIAMSSGALMPVSSRIDCQWNSSAFALTSLCDQIVINGSETTPADNEFIATDYQGLTSSLTLRVWFPSTTVHLETIPSTFSPIAGWLAPNSTGQCSQRYQRGILQANAQYAYSPSSPTFIISILSLISDQIVSSNPNVASVDNDGSVSVFSAGAATISARANLIESVSITVRSTPVQAIALDVTIFNGLSINLPPSPYPIASTQLASVTIQQQFNSVASPVFVAVLAAISDGTVMSLTEDENMIVLTSLDQSIVLSNGGVLTVIGTGSGELVRVDWISTCTGDIIASGGGLIDGQVPDPTSFILSLSSQQITYPNDMATVGGIPTTATLTISLVYPDELTRDITNDPQTILSLTQGQDLINLQNATNPIIITTASEAVGEVIITVNFEQLSENITLSVVSYQGVRIFSTPFPAYDGSDMISKNTLFRIEQTSLYQSALLELDALLSDGSSVRVTNSPLAFFQTTSSQLSLSGNIVTASQPGFYEVRGQLGPDEDSLQLLVSDNFVFVTLFLQFSPLIENDTFSGLIGAETLLTLDVQFNDSTVFSNFLPNLAGSVSNVLTLTTNTPAAVTVDSTSAMLILRDNHHSFVTVTVAKQPNNEFKAEVSFACNLMPAIGDVDLGNLDGLPLSSTPQGSLLTVPVYINAGEQALANVNLALVYDFDRLSLSTVNRAWLGSLQHSDTSSTGLLTITGSHTTGVAGLVHLATLEFDTIASGIATIEGVVLELSDNEGLDIGSGSTREFVAGRVSVEILPEVSKRSAHERARRNTVCTTAIPCEICPSDRERGDTNGDCIFDSEDPQFMLRYFAEDIFDFQLQSGMLLQVSLITQQLDQFDADLNTVVDPQDVYFLHQTQTGLLNFLTSVSILPIQDNQLCTLAINCTLLNNALSNIQVFFDISFPFDPTFSRQQMFEQSIYIRGEPPTNGGNKGLALPGGLVEAVELENGVYGIELLTNLTSSDIGVSVIQVTSEDRLATNHARTRAMFGDPNPPYTYPNSLDLTLPVFSNEIRIIASNGYSPRTSFNNTFTTTACQLPPEPPMFNQSLYTATVPENTLPGTPVLTVLAHSNSLFMATYSIVSGNTDGVFTIDQTSGVLSVAGLLDYETRTSYLLEITAIDPATSFTSSATAEITLIDLNDNHPIFIEFVTEISIEENVPINEFVTRITAEDADSEERGVVRYGISSDSDTFAIHFELGVVTVNRELNFDLQNNYIVIISASDQGNPPLSSNLTVNITILPRAPSVLAFEEPFSIITVEENAPNGTIVLELVASPITGESDGTEVVEYSIELTTIPLPFAIDSESGVVRVAGEIDREMVEMYRFTVTGILVNEPRAVPAQTAVFVSVSDINDNPPVFEQDLYQTSLRENEPSGTLKLVVRATDADQGQNSNISYSLLQSSADISIDNNGVISNTQSVDYEQTTELVITIVATDAGIPSLSAQVNVTISIIDVNDNIPIIELSALQVFINETTPMGVIIAQANASDLDLADSVLFSLLMTDTDGERTASTDFSIDEFNGQITTSAALDYERVSFYELVVVATDTRGLSSEATLLINVTDVNDNSPIFEQAIFNLTISEDTAVGSVLFSLETNDIDSPPNAETVYALITSDPVISSIFNVSSSGSVILSSSLDFESRRRYLLTVSATNMVPGAESSTANITIIITDTNEFSPVFTQSVYIATIIEESPSEVFVIQVLANDEDGTSLITYSLDLPEFRVTSNGSIFSTQPLDREALSVYNIIVLASDNSIPARNASSIVLVYLSDINDNAPALTSLTELTISEIAIIGTEVLVLTALDLDEGSNGEIGNFSILNNSSGDFNLTLNGILTVAMQLDALITPQYVLLVQVSDQGDPPLISTASITINIEPSLAPIFSQESYTVSLAENNLPNAYLISVEAKSRHPMVSIISYSLSPASMSLANIFRVDSNTGNVTVLTSLNREVQDMYSLIIQVEALFNETILTAFAQLNVSVLDENDNPPLFEELLTVVSIQETAMVDSDITSLRASDADIGNNARIEYFIISGNTENLFRINTTNGAVFTADSLVGRTGNHTLLILAVNPIENGGLNSTTQLLIIVEPVNLFTPLFSQPVYSLNVSEDSLVGAMLGVLVAMDSDQGIAGDITYSIQSGNSDGRFSINSTSGTLFLNQTVDYELQTIYNISVAAMDSGTPPLTSVAIVIINVLDLNDQRPVFTSPVFAAEVLEELPAGAIVTNITYTDGDSPPNSLVVFNVPSDFSSLFEISTDGVLLTLLTLDRENTSSYEFTVTAVNEGDGLTLTATAIVRITVRDVNDNNPVLSQSLYSRVLQAPVSANTTLLTVQATDIDAPGPNSQFLFRLIDFNNTFSIVNETGTIFINKNIENAGNFSFIVEVIDQGQPPLSSNANVIVTVLPADDLTAGRERDFIFTTDRGVHLIGAPAEVTEDTYDHRYGYPIGRSLLESRELRVGLGPLTASHALTPSLQPATSVTAILVNPLVWYDNARVQLVVQVRDEAGSVHTVTTSVLGVVTHPTLGSSDSSCFTQTSDGTCSMSISVPSDWFENRESISVQYGFSVLSLQVAGEVEIQPQLLFNPPNNNIYAYMEMPFHELFIREVFTVPVYGEAGSKAVGSFTMSVQGSSDVILAGLTVDTSVWRAETAVGSDGSRTIIAVREDLSTVPPSGRVLLFTITAQISASSSLDILIANALICTITDLSDFDRMRLLPPPGAMAQQSMALSRNGVTNSGAIYVASNQAVGLLPYTDSSELINTALLNGEPVTTPITVLEVQLNGDLLSSSSPLSCESSDPSVVSVNADCTATMLTQTNTQASSGVNISIIQGTLSSSFPVRVWIPQTLLRPMLSDTVLNRIPGLVSGESCSFVYQSTELTVFADFTDSQNIVQNVDITDMLTERLSVSDTAIASVNGRSMTGVIEGVTELRYQSPQSERNFAIEVNVTNVTVEILGLDVQVITLLMASGVDRLERLSTSSLIVQTEQVFDFEGIEGVAISAAVFSDGSRFLLDESSVIFQSLNPNVISVVGSLVTALASGEGELLQATWRQPEECSTEPVATGLGLVRVTIPQPSRIDIAVNTVLTTPGSTASSINVATSTQLTIMAVYDDGQTQDLSSDNRTEYIVPSEFTLTRNNVVTLSVNNGATAGNYIIQVIFIQFPSLGQNVTISVVELENVAISATPFPTYPGSSSNFITVLNIIAATGQRQRALIEATGILSNGESRTVSSLHSDLTFTITGDQSVVSVSSIDRSASGNVLIVEDVTRITRTLSVSAMLREVDSANSLQLTITGIVTNITMINIEPFPSETFNGIVNVAQHQIVFTAIFTDGTRYVNLFRDNQLSNLVFFTASPSSSVTINRNTGIATLRGNSQTRATITVSAVNNLLDQHIRFFTNLDSSVGDVDLGQLTGPPLSSTTVGQMLTIPVRVNSGPTVLGSLELDINFDPSIIRAVSANTGPDWPPGSSFAFNTNDPIDRITLGGILVGGAPVSGLSYLADVTFEVMGPGTTDITGMVITLAEVGALDSPAENIGDVPRPFVAGNVRLEVSGVTKRSISFQEARNIQLPQRMKRQTACLDDSPRETGDLDGNCVFDLRDATFLQQYILEDLTTGNAPILPPSRRVFLDIDSNGEVDANDVVFLLRVSFRLLRFFINPMFTSVEDSENCQITFNVTLLHGGDVPANSSSTSLVIDMAHSDSSFQDEFDNSNFTIGSLLPVTKGVDLFGGLILAADIGEGVYSFTMNSVISRTLIGISLVQITFNDEGETSPARTAALFSQSGSRYGNLDLTLSVRGQSVPLSTQLGYSPLYLYDSIQTTATCLLERLPLQFVNSSYSVSINESVPVGSEVFTVTATSTRPDAVINYAINDTSIPFSIDLTSGVITLSQLLDFETQQLYTLTLTATEEDGLYTATANLAIIILNVNDIPPVINETALVQVIATQTEGAIAQVIAEDPDGIEELQFGLVTSPDQFSINKTTGIISIASSLTNLTNSVINLNVSVSDSLFINYTTVTVDVFLPAFTEKFVIISIKENAIIGSALTNVSIENERDLIFSLDSDNSRFNVSNDGTVIVAAELDFETEPVHLINIIATSSSIVLTATINVSLIDVNDNRPTFSDLTINITVNSSTLIGELIARITATDADSTVNADISYSLHTAQSIFSLNRSTGDLFLTESLLGVSSPLDIVIVATDNGVPPLNGTARIVIRVVSLPFLSIPVAPILTASDGIVILSDPLRSEDGFTQQFSKLHDTVSEELSATLAGDSAMTSVSSSLQQGVTATATLIQPTIVYQDMPTISVAFHVRDSNYFTTVVNTTASFDVIRGAFQRNSSDSCVPDDRGVCVAVFTVPQSWFATEGTILIVEPLLNGHGEQFESMFLTLEGFSPSNSLNFQNAIVATLPYRDIVSESDFTMNVSAYISNEVVGFSVSLELHSSLQVVDIAYNNTQWGIDTTSNNNRLGIVAIVSTPVQQIAVNPQPINLFSIQLRVVSKEATSIPIIGTVHSLSDAIEGSVILDFTNSSTGPLLFTNRNGLSEMGSINIIANTLLSLFPFTMQSEILNTAALDGNTVSVQVDLLGAYLSGEILPYTADDVTCSSSNTSVINIDSTCSFLTLNGEEITGADLVLLRFNAVNITASLPVRVFYPQNLQLLSSDKILNRIQYTLADTCSFYQEALLSSFADFTAGERTLPNVVVSHFLLPYLEEDESTVLRLDGNVVYSQSPGSTGVCAGRNNNEVCIEITVTTEPVYVANVIGSLLVELSLSAASSVTSGSIETALFGIRSQLQFEQESGLLMAAVQYTDDTYSSIDSNDLLLIQPMNTSIYSVQNNAVIARGSGSAELFYRWMPRAGMCGLSVVETTSLTADLPQPLSVRSFTLESTPIISAIGSDASLAGIPTVFNIIVELLFPDNRSVSITGDSRLSYMASNNLIAVSSTGEITATGQDSGIANVLILYTTAESNLTTMLSVKVVTATRLYISVTPYPSYPGSENHQIATLSPIEDTGVWQRGVVSLFLNLTNGQTLNIISNPNATLSTVRVGTSISDDFVLSVNGAGESVIFEARLGSLVADIKFISSTNMAVSVTGIALDPLPGNILTGIIKNSVTQVSGILTFSDNTIFVNYPNSILPSELVVFSTDSDAIAVNQSGILTSLRNSLSPVNVTASSKDGAVSSTIAFTVDLDPDIGDVDLVLSPAGVFNVGDQLSVSVIINTGIQHLGVVELSLFYDNQVLVPIRADLESGWTSGLFAVSLFDSAGIIRVGGVLTTEGATGTDLHLLTLHFNVTGPSTLGESFLSGEILSLSEFGSQRLIGNPASFVAGNIRFLVEGSRKRSTSESFDEMRSRRAVDECLTTNCSCLQSIQGDVDSNCVFNLRDVSSALSYLSQSLIGSTSSLLLTDQNQDNTTDTTDVYFLFRAALDLTHFVQDVQITPVQDLSSSCVFTVNVQLSNRRNISSSQTDVLIDIGLENQLSIIGTPSTGSVLTVDKGSDLFGGVYSTVFINGSYVLELRAEFVSSMVGISIIVVTYNSRGETSTNRISQFFGPPPPTYGSLNVSITEPSLRLSALNGYSPLYTVSNSLEHSACSDTPSLAPQLNVTFSSPHQVTLEWTLLNRRLGLDFTSQLTVQVQECNISQTGVADINCPNSLISPVQSNMQHILPTSPFIEYTFVVLTLDGLQTNSVTERSPEAPPEGLSAPTHEHIAGGVILRWLLPVQPNGIITHYTLELNSVVVYNGTTLVLTLHSPITAPTNISLTAYNSAGFITSSPIVIPPTNIEVSTLSPGLPVAITDAIIVCVVLSVCVVVVLLIVLIVGMRRSKRWSKDKPPPFISLDFDAEKIGVVSLYNYIAIINHHAMYATNTWTVCMHTL